jgi:hypothetical protein
MGEDSWLAMRASWPVQLLDVSVGGAALSSPYTLEPGRTVSVRTILGGEAFHAQLRVCWSRDTGTAVAGTRQFLIGAAFVALEEESRRALHVVLDVRS